MVRRTKTIPLEGERDVVSYYFGEGGRSSRRTARHCNTTTYTVSRILIRAGHPECAWPSLVQKFGAPQPNGTERTQPPLTLTDIRLRWRDFVDALRGAGSSGNLDAFVRSACDPISLEDNTLVLGFYYSFHKEKIEDAKYRHLVEWKLSEVFGRPYKIRCVLLDHNVPGEPAGEETRKDDFVASFLAHIEAVEALRVEVAQLKQKNHELWTENRGLRQRLVRIENVLAQPD